MSRQHRPGWLRWGLGGAAWIALHVTASAAIALALALMVGDWSTLELFVASARRGGFVPGWEALGWHLVYSVMLWAGVVTMGWLLRQRRTPRARLVGARAATARGTVMVETLIVLMPFLLLTSGLAQLAMLNVAALLCDLAAFQGARAAWIWQPEADLGRHGVDVDDVRYRARTAAAMVLAPTAGADYFIGNNFPGDSGPPFRRIRTGMAASFRAFPVTGEQEWTLSMSNQLYFLEPPRQGLPRELTFSSALDSKSFHLRAGRKSTAAWMSLEDFQVVQESGEIGVHFTYKYNLLFPWFAYIWGARDTAAGRIANYSPIERRYMLPVHPQLQ